MQQRVLPIQPKSGDGKAPALPSISDPAGILQFQRACLDTATSLMKLPLSGDVLQWIRVWSEAVGQVGLVNVNYGGSRDVQAEQRITGRYSYGSQLGRTMEILAPYVAQHEAEFSRDSGADAVKEFLAMAGEISALKQASVEDLLAKVQQWQKSDGFKDKLQRLREGLQTLEGAARA